MREAKPSKNVNHPTEKPISLMARQIANSSRPGETILDTFAGSGSTLIAAEMLGRTAYLMELDCGYADHILARWEKHTGKTARRL